MGFYFFTIFDQTENTMKLENKHLQPAYPPQVMLDNFQRPVCPFPGFSKIEAVALHVLPFYLEQANKMAITMEGEKITPIEAAFITGQRFVDHFSKLTETTATIIE